MKILHLEDSPRDAELVQAIVSAECPDCEIEVVEDAPSFLASLHRGGYDVILSDYDLPGFEGNDALILSQQIAPEIPFIFCSGNIGEDRAIATLRSGAVDYVLKDRMKRLPTALRRAMRDAAERRARKQAEAHIRELAMVINHAPLAVIIWDLEHRVTYWNQGAAKLYGRTDAEVRGRTAEELFGVGYAAILIRDEWHGEVPMQTRDGRLIQAELHLSLIHDERGQPQARLSLGLDITEKKNLEEQFLRAQRMENLGMLAAGIAHDFNNILSPVLMAANLFRRVKLPPRDAKLLDALEQSVERGAALVRQILAFAYGTGAERHLVQLQHIARDIALLIEETFPRSLKFEQNIANNLRPVNANPTQIHQVLLNLCVNARDAMSERGTLSLRLRNCRLGPAEAAAIPEGRPGDFVLIEVGDTGAGIPPEILARIWEPFFTTKGPGKGTGLGLSTVRGIVSSHEGFLAIETKVGAGTTFRAYLPALQQEPPRIPAPPGIVPFGQNELVLVVDDEPNVRDLISVILGEHGYRILKARDGVEAINLLSAHKGAIQLLATDLQMPNLGGEGLIRIVRQLYPNLRVLIVSAVSSLERQPGFKPHQVGDGFLPKPFKPDALLAAVHDLLHGPARRAK